MKATVLAWRQAIAAHIPGMSVPDQTEPDVTAASQAVLLRTERAGLSMAILIRSALMVALMLFSVISQDWPQGIIGAGFISIFLAIGLAFRWLIVRKLDRLWMRYGFIAFDAVMLSLAAIHAPLSTGGDVPQILVFRVFGMDVFYFVLATAALSLSPRLVLWAGAAAVTALWTAWITITFDMDRQVSWGDLPASSTAEVFLSIFLDPDFTGRGSRVIETLLLLATAAVTAVAVDRARRLLRDQLAAERARSRLSEVFGRFVPEEVADTLAEQDGALPPTERHATVLFVDVEGFTSFASGTDPETVITVLDQFFDRVAETVSAEGGVVISLIGDAAMVAFNAPADTPEHPARALRAAVGLLNLAETQQFGGVSLALRIGVATGSVAAGTVGGQGRRSYTLYGDTVNHAQRLEALNKETGHRLICAETTWVEAGAPEGFVPVEGVSLRGRGQAETVFAYSPPD